MGPPARPVRRLVAVALMAVAAAGAGSALGSVHAPRAHAALRQQCGDAYPARRDPRNPLMLRTSPGANPLAGAKFFVDGPRHGSAAKAIEALLGLNPDRYPDSYSWTRFKHDLDTGGLHRRILRSRTLAYDISMLEKIASEPEPERFSLYSAGGGPGAIFGQVQKVLCTLHKADPGSIPIITTYFLYQAGYCESKGAILAHRGTFDRQVGELAEGIGRRPAVALLEFDAVGASHCMQRTGALPYWEANIRYEIDKLAALPHTVVYIEGGYSDAAGPGYAAGVLRAVGVKKIRGFFTNDTHSAWTINEIRWGDQVVKLLHGSHFIVNTATNGRGPLRPPDPVHQGNEVLCNAPGRGLGPEPTTSTGFANVDAFLFTGVPGNSSGTCDGGPPSGTFWAQRAIGLASRANQQLGPGFPRRPY